MSHGLLGNTIQNTCFLFPLAATNIKIRHYGSTPLHLDDTNLVRKYKTDINKMVNFVLMSMIHSGYDRLPLRG